MKQYICRSGSVTWIAPRQEGEKVTSSKHEQGRRKSSMAAVWDTVRVQRGREDQNHQLKVERFLPGSPPGGTESVKDKGQIWCRRLRILLSKQANTEDSYSFNSFTPNSIRHTGRKKQARKQQLNCNYIQRATLEQGWSGCRRTVWARHRSLQQEMLKEKNSYIQENVVLNRAV